MTVEELVRSVNNAVAIKINVLGEKEIMGRTGVYLTENLIKVLHKKGLQDAYVFSITPLWGLHELYVECVKVLE